MKLSSEDGTVILSPTGRDVAKIVAALVAPGNEFAVLEAEGRFIQLLVVGDGRYALQKNLGNGSGGLKASKGKPLSRDAAIDVLSKFAAGRRDWSRGISWTTDGTHGEPFATRTKVIAAVTALLVLAILALGVVV